MTATASAPPAPESPANLLTAELRREHALILAATVALERCGARIQTAGEDTYCAHRNLGTLIRFFLEFVEGWHDAKEEEVLVPSLLLAGALLGRGPVAAVVQAHVRARELLDGLSSRNEAVVLATIPEYAEFMRQHMMMEERVLFPLAEKILDASAKRHLAHDFARVDSRKGGAPRRAHLVKQLAHLLVPLSELEPSPAHPW